MTKQDWEIMYDEFTCLMDEFYEIWAHPYKTTVSRREKRVTEIINDVVSEIKRNTELVDIYCKDKTEGFKEHMILHNGLREESKFRQQMSEIMYIIKSKVN